MARGRGEGAIRRPHDLFDATRADRRTNDRRRRGWLRRGGRGRPRTVWGGGERTEGDYLEGGEVQVRFLTD